jgi:hypothetical protein
MGRRDDHYETVGDAGYEMWRRGYSPDSLDRDEAYSRARDGWSGDEIAEEQIREQRQDAQQAAEMEEEYARAMAEEHLAEEFARHTGELRHD